jgi:glycosyltransferase involved in cell wall biosynthesis
MITIVISSFHYGHLASHCIESVLSQTKMPERILFVDDGAGDCEYLQKFYPEIEYILRSENLGVVNNFDDMLRRVNSEFVMFVGADNWLRSDTIEVFENVVKQTSCDVVTYDIIVSGELKEEILNRHPNEVKLKHGDYYWTRNGHHGSMLYRTKLGQEIGYKQRLQNSSHTEEDWNLWNEMIKRNAKIVRIPDAFLYYRRHRENFLKY